MKIYKLDLHRMLHRDVRRTVIRFIEEHWGKQTELEIVTGNSAKMKSIVIDVLDEYKLDYQIGRPLDLNNKGYIITWIR